MTLEGERNGLRIETGEPWNARFELGWISMLSRRIVDKGDKKDIAMTDGRLRD
jgi:hypothetical protein